MALRTVPIRRAANRVVLFMGGDRKLVLFSGVLAFALIFTAQRLPTIIFGALLWFFALFVFRKLAKADPLMRQVYMRHMRYRKYYPARSTPWRVNTRLQGSQYK
jgi:type IV secretion system protein VirB3